MNSLDIINAMGEIDDELIENSDVPRKSHRNIIIAICSAAACLVMVCAGAMILNRNSDLKKNDSGSLALGVSDSSNAIEEMEDLEAVPQEYTIYYVDNGEVLASETPVSVYELKEAFDVWREKNGINSDVKFISLHIDDNSTDSVYDYGDSKVVMHTVGDYFICRLTVSEELKEIFAKPGGELLEESLQKTILLSTGWDELEIIFE